MNIAYTFFYYYELSRTHICSHYVLCVCTILFLDLLCTHSSEVHRKCKDGWQQSKKSDYRRCRHYRGTCHWCHKQKAILDWQRVSILQRIKNAYTSCMAAFLSFGSMGILRGFLSSLRWGQLQVGHYNFHCLFLFYDYRNPNHYTFM